MKKKVLSVFLVAAILCSLLVTAAGAVSVSNFTDVKSDDWFYEYVDYVSSKNYMIGVSETEFAPQANMTRAMFVTVLSRIDNAKVDNTVSVFDDVPANTWYTGAVAWAYKNGITTGTSATTFSPNANVTRQDMSTFIARFVDYYAKENSLTHKMNGKLDAFTDDASIAAYAKDSVDRARNWGLVIGFPDGSFRPADYSTRAQVAAVVSRLDWLVNPTGGGTTPPAGPTITTETKDYFVQIDVNGHQLQSDNYTVTTTKTNGTVTSRTSTETADAIALSLISNSDNNNNETTIKNGISAVLSKLEGFNQSSTATNGWVTKSVADVTAMDATIGAALTAAGVTGDVDLHYTTATAKVSYTSGMVTGTVDAVFDQVRDPLSGAIYTVNFLTTGAQTTLVVNGSVVDISGLVAYVNTQYAAKKNAAVTAILNKAGLDSTDATLVAKAGAIYDAAAPSFLTASGTGIQVSTSSDDYYNILKNVVNASIDLWKAAKLDDSDYSTKGATAITKIAGYGLTVNPDAYVYEIFGSAATGTPDANIIADAVANSALAWGTANGTLNQTNYTKALDKVDSYTNIKAYTVDGYTAGDFISTIPAFLDGKTVTVTVTVEEA